MATILRERKELESKVVIIGAGIAGLSAALSLSIVGHDVLVIDNRADCTRDQRIYIPNDLILKFYDLSELKKMGVTLHFFDDEDEIPEDSNKEFEILYSESFVEPDPSNLDLQFFRLLEKKFGIIPIHALQSYQLAKLKFLIEERSCSYPVPAEYYTAHSHIPLYFDNEDWRYELMSAPSPIPLTMQREILKDLGILNPPVRYSNFKLKGKIEFLMGPQYQVVSVDGDNQTLSLQKEGMVLQIPFTHLVAADGSHHPTMNLLAQNPKYRFSQRNLQSPRHNAYGLAQLQFKKEDLKFQSEKKGLRDLKKTVFSTYLDDAFQFAEEHVKLLSECGWQESYFPYIFLVVDPEKNDAYLTGEIPFDLLPQDNESISVASEKNARRIKWFETIFKCLTKCEQLSLESAKVSPFKVQTSAFNKNHYSLGKGGQVILVGDSFIPANFLYGHGAKAAIQDGNVLYCCFEDAEDFDPCPLDYQATARFDEYRFYRDKLESLRKYRAGFEPVLEVTSLALPDVSRYQETKEFAPDPRINWDECVGIGEMCPYDCKCGICQVGSSLIFCNQNLRSQSYMEGLMEELTTHSLVIAATELTMAKELGWLRYLQKDSFAKPRKAKEKPVAASADSTGNCFALIPYKGY